MDRYESPEDRIDNLCHDVAVAGFLAHERKLTPDYAGTLATRLRSASLDMVVPSDAALLNSTASALEQVSTRVKAGDIRTRAKSSARPSRPQLNVAELVRRWDEDAFSGGGTFDRDGWEDVESRRVAEQNRVLRERQRKLEEQRGR